MGVLWKKVTEDRDSNIHGFELSREVLSLLNRLDAWSASFPANCLVVEKAFFPPDDWENEVTIEFKPKHQQACSLWLGITSGRASSYNCFISLSNLREIAEREDLSLSPLVSPNLVALYWEPVSSLTSEEIVEICQSVADGKVSLKLGLIGRKIVGTEGYLPLSQAEFQLSGVGDLWLAKLASTFKCAQIRELRFEPWLAKI